MKGLQIWAIIADQNFAPFLPTGPAQLNFIKILSLFNTQSNRYRASPAIFKHVGQVPYSRVFKFGERADQNFAPFLPTGPALLNFIRILSLFNTQPNRLGLLNFIKILSLFNTQPNRPRASPAIFKHVGQVPYSRCFKFGE